MGYACKIVLDSISPDQVRLTTIEVTFPRIVLSEFNTHRVFSRNSASSRAVPVAKRIQMALEDPYVPTQFGRNQKGMQSGDPLAGAEAESARTTWLRARDAAVVEAHNLSSLGVHKEYANRLLEPFLWHTCIVTSTEWPNFWNLRCHRNASEPIRRAAEMMWDCYDKSQPKLVDYGDWHLPYVKPEELFEIGIGLAKKVCVGRCARVSYLTHDGRRAPKEDVELHDALLKNGHMSPFEHAARPAAKGDRGRRDVEVGKFTQFDFVPGYKPNEFWFGNFRGWVQYRKTIPGEDVFRG